MRDEGDFEVVRVSSTGLVYGTSTASVWGELHRLATPNGHPTRSWPRKRRLRVTRTGAGDLHGPVAWFREDMDHGPRSTAGGWRQVLPQGKCQLDRDPDGVGFPADLFFMGGEDPNMGAAPSGQARMGGTRTTAGTGATRCPTWGYVRDPDGQDHDPRSGPEKLVPRDFLWTHGSPAQNARDS